MLAKGDEQKNTRVCGSYLQKPININKALATYRNQLYQRYPEPKPKTKEELEEQAKAPKDAKAPAKGAPSQPTAKQTGAAKVETPILSEN